MNTYTQTDDAMGPLPTIEGNVLEWDQEVWAQMDFDDDPNDAQAEELGAGPSPRVLGGMPNQTDVALAAPAGYQAPAMKAPPPGPPPMRGPEGPATARPPPTTWHSVQVRVPQQNQT